MNIENRDRAERLLICLSEIDDDLIEEAATADISQRVGRRRLVKYGAVTAGVSGIVAAIYFLLRVWAGKRGSATL